MSRDYYLCRYISENGDVDECELIVLQAKAQRPIVVLGGLPASEWSLITAATAILREFLYFVPPADVRWIECHPSISGRGARYDLVTLRWHELSNDHAAGYRYVGRQRLRPNEIIELETWE